MKFKKWKLIFLLVPVVMIITYMKQDQELNSITEGRYYLIVKNKSSRTASLDKTTWVEFSGNKITFKEGSKETVIQYNSKYRTFKKEGKSYLFVDNHGNLSISDLDSHDSVSYVSPESSMYSGYEEGRAIVYD